MRWLSERRYERLRFGLMPMAEESERGWPLAILRGPPLAGASSSPSSSTSSSLPYSSSATSLGAASTAGRF